MQINKAVLQIFDFTSSLAVYSEHELKVSDEGIQTYLQTHVDKAFKDPGARTGYLHSDSLLGKRLSAYANGSLNLVDVAKEIGEKLFSYMAQATDPLVMDVIFCEAMGESPYLCLLECQAHDAYTHQLFSEEDGSLTTELVQHKAVLPTVTQKLRAFFAIRLSDFAVHVFEPKGEYDGEVTYILADKVLQIGTEQSSKETIKKIRTIVNQIAQAHESDGVAEISLTKELIAKNAEVSDSLNPVELIERVFNHNPVQQSAAKKELEELHMVKELLVSREFASKIGQNHKIKTDTGIEISFPVEYTKNKEFMEIVTNADGTLRIELKNISKITNK